MLWHRKIQGCFGTLALNMGVESMLAPFVRQAEIYGLGAYLLDHGRDG
jgi:hypothetical protein